MCGSSVSDRRVRSNETGAVRLPVGERAELLALVRQLRAALAEGPSRARELVLAIERALEAELDGRAEQAGA